MLAIAGGIIIAVLVLAYLDVILALLAYGIAFVILAVLGIGAIWVLVLIYEAAPTFTTVVGIAAIVGYIFINDRDIYKGKSSAPEKPTERRHWKVQISGVEPVGEGPVETSPASETALKSGSNAIDWHDLGEPHETLDDAIAFARWRYDVYKQKSSSAEIRVISNEGEIHHISSTHDFDSDIKKLLNYLRRKIVFFFRK